MMTFKRRRPGNDRAAGHALAAGPPVSGVTPAPVDVHAVREHFAFPRLGRIVTNNAASTQPPDELLALYQSLAPGYENVHRGQSTASQAMTALFEESYDTIARFIGAPGRASIALYRNTTEAHNAVMYSLLGEFRNGDNVVTTTMEHNSNYVPWYAMCREILPRFGRRVHYRLARFDPVTGELDLDHLASLIDARTKLVCCTGASNFLGTRNPLRTIRALANASGYRQPNGERRSHLLIDGAQLVPGSFVDVQDLDVEYLSFSFHKMLAPFGVGVLYTKPHLLATSLPFLYGGDMIAEGRVPPHLARLVQPRGSRSGRRRGGPEHGRGGIARGLPLRHARPSQAPPGSSRELPPELLPLQHAGRRRPRRGRGSRRRQPPDSGSRHAGVSLREIASSWIFKSLMRALAIHDHRRPRAVRCRYGPTDWRATARRRTGPAGCPDHLRDPRRSAGPRR
jgi:Aminotransferase class-V